MMRVLALLVVGLGVWLGAVGVAAAGPMHAERTAQIPPLTPEQVAVDCAIAGVGFSAMTTLGVVKPMTAAITSIPGMTILHEAFYGCGIGVISGYLGQTLVDLLPLPPQPSPFAPQSAALITAEPPSP